MFTYRQLSASDPQGANLAVEAAMFGLAYSSFLCWATTCLVASFRVANLARPYWSAIHDLRTDTCGVAAFVAAAVSLAVSEYLRLRRLQEDGARPGGRRHRALRSLR